MATVGPPELILILVLALLLFGGAKLPKLARSLGQAQREFRTGLSESADSDEGADPGADRGPSGPVSSGGSGSSSSAGNGAARKEE